MNNEQIRKVYTDANTESHTQALRAVYEAGRKHDEWLTSERRRAEDQRVADHQLRLSEEKRAAEDKRTAEQRMTPEEKRLVEDRRLAEEKRAAEDKRVTDEKKAADEKRAASDKSLEEERLTRLGGNVAAGGEPLTTQGEVDARHAAGLQPEGRLPDPGHGARLDKLEQGQVVTGQGWEANRGAWQASTAYAVGDYLFTGTNRQNVTTAGTSGTVKPSFLGATTSDGTVVWSKV